MLFQDYLDDRLTSNTNLDNLADALQSDPGLPQSNELDEISCYMTDSPHYTASQVNALSSLWKSYLKQNRRTHNRFGVKQTSLNLPAPLNDQIEKYRKRNNIQSYNQAAIFLIEKGLR